ncbi:Endonuclease/exonuclease/phosphatase, partial [Elaphomyces granulatus]
MSCERTQNTTERHSQGSGEPGDCLKQLTILQFNCGAANYGVSRPIFDAVAPDSRNILAIQEPAYSKRTMTTYCPRGYKLAYDPNPTTKVCFLVGDQIHTSHWSYQAHSPYVASLRVQAMDGPIDIINVYNPRGNGPRISTWTTIEKVIDAAPGRVILLGDFNAHHSEWGGVQAACEAQSEHLLIETRRWDLHLLNPKGVATWKRGQRESVIDLVFASGSLKESVMRCKPREDWAVAQDHIPIDILFDVETLPRPPCKRFALSKLDRPSLIRYIKASDWQKDTEPLCALQRALAEGLEASCPRVRPCSRASRKWSPRASELLAGAR